ncbi:MAG: GIY-YIG nuclease family protein [Flavisolibacter sp.]
MYVVYILACSDGSYYTGITNDLDKRLWQHETGFFPDCYTCHRRPVVLRWHEYVNGIDNATKREKQIKGWSRKKKEALIENNFNELKRLSQSKKS